MRKYPWFIIYYNLFPHGDSVLFVRKAMLIAFVLKFFTFWYIISNYLSMVSLSHHSLMWIFSKYRNISLKNSSDCLYSGNIFSSSLKKKCVISPTLVDTLDLCQKITNKIRMEAGLFDHSVLTKSLKCGENRPF